MKNRFSKIITNIIGVLCCVILFLLTIGTLVWSVKWILKLIGVI